MIISASRRTDIPAFYSEWFFNRLDEGYAMVRNPYNPGQIKKADLSPEAVDGFVFWTKDPKPMIPYLDRLMDYTYYFTFTVTPYSRDIEPGLRDKKDIIETFKRLSELLGPERVIWRYDPILINGKYSMEYHLNAYSEMALSLGGYTKKCVISFLDEYKNISKVLKSAGCSVVTENNIRQMAESFSKAAGENEMILSTCCEALDLSDYGIVHNRCIDDGLLSKLSGSDLEKVRDRNQRKDCGCATSIDIGAYDTCSMGCIYCYAVHGKSKLKINIGNHDPASPYLDGLLCD